jgi:acetyl-CoA carboxylase biotin carboxyl carrier protein
VRKWSPLNFFTENGDLGLAERLLPPAAPRVAGERFSSVPMPLWLDADGPATSGRSRGKESGVAEEIRAEMVANVWKVVVAAGDTVEDGDTLVILESMKMEIPVITETSGTVSALHVAEGDVVQEGDVIAVIG